MNFIEELKWRGMVQDLTPGTEERLSKGMAAAYVGYDPTAPSLHVGNLATIMLLVHFQRAGHKPIALVGGATGMIGDPSGRSEERQLLSVEVLRFNQEKIRAQLEKFLDFDCSPNPAEIVNNYDWFKDINFLDFLRDVGKHLTLNYMMAKESVSARLERGISFTEFSYQLLQAYDFFWLYRNRDCVLQMGGSDQWGNITSGTELIRRKISGEAHALTCPLLTRSDGSKFGKSEGQNIWLSPEMTSPYKFYQYWLNCSDDDAAGFVKIFTLLREKEIMALINEHSNAPHQRLLQKTLARELTVRVHSEDAYRFAVEASDILFGRGTSDSLQKLSENDLLDIFDGVPRFFLPQSVISEGVNVVDLLVEHSRVFSSKGEARRMIQGGGLGINKEKINSLEYTITGKNLLNNRILLVQKGKKNYYLLILK